MEDKRNTTRKNRRTIKNYYLHYDWRYKPLSKHYADERLFTKVVTRLMEKISEYILEGGTYKLPHRMGNIRIRKFKPTKRRAINWQLTKKYKKHIYHTNKHSSGYSGEWYWEKRKALLKNKSLYSFDATRTNKRNLAKLILHNNQIRKYYE